MNEITNILLNLYLSIPIWIALIHIVCYVKEMWFKTKTETQFETPEIIKLLQSAYSVATDNGVGVIPLNKYNYAKYKQLLFAQGCIKLDNLDFLGIPVVCIDEQSPLMKSGSTSYVSTTE